MLVDFRRVDLGQNVAFFHVTANVLVPFFQIAIGSRVNWRLDVGFERPGQNHFGIGIDGSSVDHRNVGNGSLLRLLRERLVFAHALRDRINSENRENDKHNQKPTKHRAGTAARAAGLALEFGFVLQFNLIIRHSLICSLAFENSLIS